MTRCYHCDLAVPEGFSETVCIEDVEQPMCCPGCAAVAEFIIDQGLQNYYKFRSAPAPSQKEVVPSLLRQYSPSPAETKGKGIPQQKGQFLISGIACAACVWLIETQLQRHPAIIQCQVNLSTHQANFCWDPTQLAEHELLKLIADLGYQAEPYQAEAQELQQKNEFQQALKRLAVAGLGVMQVMTYAFALYIGFFQGMSAEYVRFFHWTSLIITTPILAYSGTPFIQSALRALKLGHVNMDVPISLAIVSAYVASVHATLWQTGHVYFDSVCMFIFFLTLARFLEMVARHRNSQTILRLQQLTPHNAIRYNNDVAESIPLKELVPGDTVLVRPGEAIPTDGLLLSGAGCVSEAVITGEQTPIHKAQGATLLAGAMNLENPLVMKVTQNKNSTLATIVDLLQQAQSERPALVTLTNRISGYFVGAILLLAVLVAYYWWQVAPEQAFVITLSVLVATCPCALSLATPAALSAAGCAMMEKGFLIRKAHVLEGLAQATDIVFDKTGTLTEGKLSLTTILPFAAFESESALSIAKSLELFSEHPIAKAFEKTESEAASAKNLINHPGSGIEGVVAEQSYRLGKAEFVIPGAGISPPDNNHIWVLLGSESTPIAWFGIQDTPRAEVAELLQALNHSQDLRVHLLSGDSQLAADDFVSRRTHTEAFFTEVRGNLSPEDKLNRIKQLQQEGKKVIMVGDGLNDAPVLAGANISIAIGQGSDLAKASADAVLLSENINVLTDALLLAKKTRRVIKQNFLWAVGYNLSALPLAACGLLPPYLAAIGMSCSSLLVVLNALRLRKLSSTNKRDTDEYTLLTDPH